MGLLSAIFGVKGKQSAIEKQIKLRAEEFIITYGNEFKGLDFSVQSLSVLDRLLENFALSWQEISQDSKNELITNASSYVVWVVKQQYGGNFYWSEQNSQPVLVIGEPNYRIAIMSQDVVNKRIKQGAKFNIPDYCRKIAEEQSKAINKTDIIIN